MKGKALKRAIAMTLAMVMVFALLPMSVFRVYADTEPLVPDGDYLIYNPAKNVVLSSEYTGFYNNPVSMTITDVTAVQQVDAALIWHVANNASDGTVTISNANRKLAMQDSYTSMPLDSANDTWVIEQVEGSAGLYVIRNAVRSSNYVNYQETANPPRFSAYDRGTPQTDVLYQFNFVPAEESVTPPEPPEPPVETLFEKLTEAPADGDEVVIYSNYRNGSAVLGSESATSSGIEFMQKGIEATPDADGKLALAEGMAVLTVHVSDGVYTFTLEDGRYLGIPSRNCLTFSETAGENYQWTLQQHESGKWYVVNVGYQNHNTPQVIMYNDSANRFYSWSLQDFNESLLIDFYGNPEETPSETLVPDGDYLIYNPANNVVMSSERAASNSNYNERVSMTIEDVTAVQEVDETLIWHVKNNEDGTVTISNNGRKLSMDTQYSSTPFDKEHDTWEIAEAETEGLLCVKNIGRSLYLEYYASKNYFSCYDNGSVLTDPLYQFNFVPAVLAETPPEPPAETLLEKLTEAPADGDELVIYHPTSSKVLGSAANGNKLSGVSATLDAEGKLPLAEGMALLTVSVTDGVYTFKLEDGGYLTTGATGNSLSFAAEESDYSKWTVEKTGDNWNIVNLNAVSNNKRQALEYYNNAYTTWGLGTSDAFKFDFYGLVDNHLVPDGDYLIYNPAKGVAMSTNLVATYYNGPVNMTIADVTAVQEVTEDLIWHVTNNDEDGTITITNNGRKLSMATTRSSTPFDEVNDTWQIVETGTDGLYGIKNIGRNVFLEYYESKGYFSGYGTSCSDPLFQFNFVPAVLSSAAPTVIEDGDEVVIYNPGDSSVLGMPNELGTALAPAAAVIEDGKAIVANGGRVFTVGVSGDYYTFCSGGQYLATNNDEGLFLTDDLADDGATACTYWYLTADGNSYVIYSKSAKYKNSAVCIEFFAGNYSGWTFKASDKDLFLFQFYPVADDTLVVNGVVDKPEVVFTDRPAYRLTEYQLEFKVFSLFSFQPMETEIYVNGQLFAPDNVGAADLVNYIFRLSVPADLVTGEALEIEVSAVDEHGAPIEGSFHVPIIDEPVIMDLTPERNAETGENKRPEIGATISNYGENPTVVMTVNGETVSSSFNLDTGRISYIPPQDMEDGKVTVEITVTRADGKSKTEQWSFWIGESTFSLYFGQLHSHTAEYSDGAGTLASALEYIDNIPESGNVDFVAFTDHSNYFDSTSASNPADALYDASQMTAESRAKWNRYLETASEFNASHSDIIALSGFEMTWSGGPGHINTFCTPGLVSRNNSVLNNKTNDAGMKAYYELLSRSELIDSISQFNHPGKTFGNFTDFSYYDPVIDTRMYLVEVGNGEGQIGAGGYYPSYEQYVMALDKGWHVAPTNNQDNHKGSWGNANNARDVVLAEDFSPEGIYSAIRAYRVYATEDKNLEILYTLNDEPLGSTITEIPETLNISVSVFDPDSNDSFAKVEVVANSGKTVHTWNSPTAVEAGNLSVSLDPDYSYYFIRVTENDGDIAVTAPVWVGESLKLGISSFECQTDIPVTDEAATLTTTLFNSEAQDAVLTSLTYTLDGSEVLHVDTTERTVPKSGTLSVDFEFTPENAKVYKVTVTAVMELDGKEYTFTKDIELDVKDADSLVYIGIDASHYNEYVSGNYKDSMGNFGTLAAEYGVRTVILNTSEELIAACGNEKYKGLIFTAPSRRLPAAQEALLTYTNAELDAIKGFNLSGGMVVVAGWSDYYENYSEVSGMSADQHMAATQNAILEALGTELRVNDDATIDDELNGNQSQRLYFNSYNMDSFLMEGVEVDPDHPNDRLYSEVYSQYGGCSIYTTSTRIPEGVTTAVFGHATTYSKDSDGDGIGGSTTPKYEFAEGDDRLLITATDEQEGKGVIVVSGAAFMSNFEVQATLDNGTEKNYSNYKVCENLLRRLNPEKITPIADVRAVTETGYTFTIEGIVTSNASGYDKDTAFFDCIYVQDNTAGICCFPVSGEYKIGDLVRITGTTDFYQGEPELQVKGEVKVIGTETCPDPVDITAAQQADRSKEGSLVRVSGTITKVESVNGQIQTILYEDGEGNVGRIFIDGYITTLTAGYEDVAHAEVGNKVTAVGLASYDDTFNAPEGPFPRIRIRNRADVVCEEIVLPGIRVRPIPESSFTEGEDYITVNRSVKVVYEVACKVGYLEDGVYVPCEVFPTDDGYYTFDVPEGVDEVILVMKGDANLDGRITLADSTLVKSYFNRAVTHTTMLPEELFAGNVVDERVPEIKLSDSTRIKAVFNGRVTQQVFHWELD